MTKQTKYKLLDLNSENNLLNFEYILSYFRTIKKNNENYIKISGIYK